MSSVLRYAPMGRPTKDKSGPATETLTLRLTAEDRDLLNRLVALRAEELSDEAGEVTATSYVRAFIRREARAKGLVAEGKQPSPRKPAGTREATADNVRAALVRTLKTGESQRSIARRAGVNAAGISRFVKGEAGLAPESLQKLAAALKLT
jgi:Helix-turn-helix